MKPSYLGLLADRPLLREAILPAMAFVTIAGLGVVGFMLLGGVSVVDAAFWLIDPTSIELYFQRHAGPVALTKLYALAITIGLLLTGLWAGETVVAAAFGGQIRTEMKRARDRRHIMELSDHIIICGYGMFGQTIARGLRIEGTDLVVIETDPAVAAKAREDGHHVVDGDARLESILENSGITRARSIVAAVDDSNVNLQISITASQLTSSLNIVVRVGSQLYESLAYRAGADYVVIPEVLSGEDVADHL